MCTSENNAIFVLFMFCPCAAPSFYLTQYWRNCDSKCKKLSFGQMNLQMSTKWWQFCLGLNGLRVYFRMCQFLVASVGDYQTLCKRAFSNYTRAIHGAFIGNGLRQSVHSGINIGNQVWYFCMQFYTDFSNGLISPYVATSNIAI